MNPNWIVLGIGALLLLGCFATINSNSTNSFDHDLAFLLLIGGIICFAFGLGFFDLDAAIEKYNEFMERGQEPNSQ